jgi:hypothetical protein
MASGPWDTLPRSRSRAATPGAKAFPWQGPLCSLAGWGLRGRSPSFTRAVRHPTRLRPADRSPDWISNPRVFSGGGRGHDQRGS